jgi:hypothetical protein
LLQPIRRTITECSLGLGVDFASWIVDFLEHW